MRRGLALAAPLLVLACGSRAERELTRGNHAAREGRLEDARTAYQAAVEAEAQNGRAWALLGLVHYQLGDRRSAEAAWQRAMPLSGGGIEAGLGLALLELDRGAPGPALQHLGRLPQPTMAENPIGLMTRARAFLARGEEGDAERALADAEAAARKSPGSPEAAYLRGCSLLALGRFSEAQQSFDALQQATPGSPLGAYGNARVAAAQSRVPDAFYYLRASQAAAGPQWSGGAVAKDPAFAFLSGSTEFLSLVRP